MITGARADGPAFFAERESAVFAAVDAVDAVDPVDGPAAAGVDGGDVGEAGAAGCACPGCAGAGDAAFADIASTPRGGDAAARTEPQPVWTARRTSVSGIERRKRR
ncbi:MAG: hypothetical protein JWP87_5434 [Labilithrix sp.]|nr:hypothetical protein [Labilithrix sp.]